MDWDLAIVGGGPAGLAVAIRAGEAGLRAVVLERSAGLPDKACGEGLMPGGVRGLESLGALARIPPEACAPFRGIRYLQETGGVAEARFRAGAFGLGVRRTALVAALEDRAQEAGAVLRKASVRGVLRIPGPGAGLRVDLAAHAGEPETSLSAAVIVAADGLHSPLRRWAGLDRPAAPRPRFGLRRHYAIRPWADLVEVYWSAGCEAYVTPVAPDAVNVALLLEEGELPSAQGERRYEALLERFPALAARLAGAPFLSDLRGAGPLRQRVRSRAGKDVALLGDAAGSVDSITGQGLSMTFEAAGRLVASLPRPVASEALPAALQAYDRSVRGSWRRYAIPASLLLALARRPALRRAALGVLERHPWVFRAILGALEGV